VERESLVQRLIERVPDLEPMVDEAFLADPGAQPVRVVSAVTRALFPRDSELSAGKDAERDFLGFVDDALAAGDGGVEYDLTPVEGWFLLNPHLRAAWRDAIGERLQARLDAANRGSFGSFSRFLERVLREIPEAWPVVEREYEVMEGDLYSTMLLSKLSDFILERQRAVVECGDRRSREIVGHWLRLVEDAVALDPTVADLLNQTFVEDLALSDVLESVEAPAGSEARRGGAEMEREIAQKTPRRRDLVPARIRP
jgi:hypothetical protein